MYTAPADIQPGQTVTIRASSVETPLAFAVATVNLVSIDPIRLNAGGGAYTDSLGQLWQAATFATGGGPFQTNQNIVGTADPQLYRTEHYGNGSLLSYRIDAVNGSYQVTLKFAEIYYNAANQRVMNIVINGQTVESNFDVFAAAGGAFAAVDRSYNIQVTNGRIDIDLAGVVSNPKLSAIEILPTP